MAYMQYKLKRSNQEKSKKEDINTQYQHTQCFVAQKKKNEKECPKMLYLVGLVCAIKCLQQDAQTFRVTGRSDFKRAVQSVPATT